MILYCKGHCLASLPDHRRRRDCLALGSTCKRTKPLSPANAVLRIGSRSSPARPAALQIGDGRNPDDGAWKVSSGNCRALPRPACRSTRIDPLAGKSIWTKIGSSLCTCVISTVVSDPLADDGLNISGNAVDRAGDRAVLEGSWPSTGPSGLSPSFTSVAASRPAGAALAQQFLVGFDRGHGRFDGGFLLVRRARSNGSLRNSNSTSPCRTVVPRQALTLASSRGTLPCTTRIVADCAGIAIAAPPIVSCIGEWPLRPCEPELDCRACEPFPGPKPAN